MVERLVETKEPGICDHVGCHEHALYIVAWPGSEPKNACEPHKDKAIAIAGAMGFYLHTERLPVEQQTADEPQARSDEERRLPAGAAHEQHAAIGPTERSPEGAYQRIGSIALELDAPITQTEARSLLIDCATAISKCLREHGHGRGRIVFDD